MQRRCFSSHSLVALALFLLIAAGCNSTGSDRAGSSRRVFRPVSASRPGAGGGIPVAQSTGAPQPESGVAPPQPAAAPETPSHGLTPVGNEPAAGVNDYEPPFDDPFVDENPARRATRLEAEVELQSIGAEFEYDAYGNTVAADLSGTGATDADIEFLESFPNLEQVNLRGTAVTDEGLATIARIPGIRLLALSQTGVGDQGVARLDALSGLQYLLLDQTRVTDRTLDRLTDRSDLRGISLNETAVTDDAVNRFRTARPDCRVFRKEREASESTSLVPEAMPTDRQAIWNLSKAPEKQLPYDIASRSTSPPRRVMHRTTASAHGFTGGGLSDPRILQAFASVLSASGDWEQAARTLEQALQIAPENDEIRFQLAVALTHAGHIDIAREVFAECVGDAAAHYNVGVILCQKAIDDSMWEFKMALDKDPTLSAARYWHDRVDVLDVCTRRYGDGGQLPLRTQPLDNAALKAPGMSRPPRPKPAVKQVGYSRSPGITIVPRTPGR